MSTFYTPESAMVIVAHPDDIEFTCVGTVARWVKGGARAAYVLCTSGDVGIDEPGMTRAWATEIREAEAWAAAEIAGVTDVVFLREPDGLLQATLELRKKLVREIRRFRPEVVIAGDPVVLWPDDEYPLNHPDHRAAALAALDAVFPAAGQPNLFEELAEEGLEGAQGAQGLRDRVWRRRLLREHRRDDRREGGGAAGAPEPDEGLGPGGAYQAVGTRDGEGQGDDVRGELSRPDAAGRRDLGEERAQVERRGASAVTMKDLIV